MHDLSYLPEVLLLLLCSIFIVVLMQRLQLSPVLGYLLVGAVIGHFDLIDHPDVTKTLADFGVVFLLFIVGLELTFKRLMKMRLHLFGFGSLQIFLTTLATTFFFYKIFHLDLTLSIIVSSSIALSSTAIVMQVLAETKRQSTQVGRLSLSVLLMQDLAVVPLLTILPMLAQNGNQDILSALSEAGIRAIAIIVAIVISGRLLLRPLFRIIGSANKDEIYVNTALLIVLGASWITGKYGLSSAMGAFLAGLLIAETEYRNKIEDSIMPFQGLFLALFFIATGMSINIEHMVTNFNKVLFLSFVIILIKFSIVFVLCRIFRFGMGASIHAGLLLSQGGEFAFILFGLANQQKIMGNELTQLLFMVVAFTMAVTPLLSTIGQKIEELLEKEGSLYLNHEFRGVSDLNNHVIIVGFGRVGRMIAYMLEQMQIEYVGIDGNLALVKEVREEGYMVYHGDPSSLETIASVGLDRASYVVLSTSDRSILRKAVRNIRKEYKNIHILARTEDIKQAHGAEKLGASTIMPSSVEMGIHLATMLMQKMELPEHEIISLKEKLRKNNYEVVKEVELYQGIRKIKNVN